jgi:hypothetical protein
LPPGIVSAESRLVLRSTEIQPACFRFVALPVTGWSTFTCPPLGTTTWHHHLAPPLGATTWRLHLAPPLGATTWRHHFAPPLGTSTWRHHLAPPLGAATWRHHLAPAFHGVGPTPWNAVTFGHGTTTRHHHLAAAREHNILRNSLRSRWPRSPRCNYPLASRFILLMGSAHW